jgi:hypothetical protein
MLIPSPSIKPFSYKILNPKAVELEKDPKKIAGVILDAVKLDPESFRLGNTKACNPVSFCLIKRRILDVFLFCDLFLSNPHYHCKYKEWKFPILKVTLMTTHRLSTQFRKTLAKLDNVEHKL